MRPPWIEAGPMLAAAGFPLAPIKPVNPLVRSLRMADFAPFAFAERLDGVVKPRVFSSAANLARHIEGRRHGQAIELVDVEDIEVPNQPGLYTGVQVFTLLIDGGRDRCLGYAWLDGQGRDRLEPAMRAVRRDVGRKAVA
jgi:hypothetical protein